MKRVATSLVLIPLVLSIIFWSPSWAVLAAVTVVASLCFHEYRGLAAAYGARTRVWGYAAGVALLAVPRDALLIVVAAALIALSLELRANALSETLPNASATVLGIVYIFGCWRFALELHAIAPYWLLYALAINWIGDISAFYFGRTFGRHRLAPVVSPGKSWEGAAASVLTAVVFGVLYLGRFAPEVSPVVAGFGSAFVNAAAQLGDLAESALKRGANVKDSGALLPGHGGMLDRVDSTLFSLPAVYLVIQISRLL